jgi:hypothetical protein
MDPRLQTPQQQKADELARHFSTFPQVGAVALGGSQSSGAADTESDIDLYVYIDAEISRADQAAVIERSGGAIRTDLHLPCWGGVNMWIDTATSITVDCMYFGTAWMEEQITRVMEAHQPSLGYSTCFCRTVRQSQVLYDPRGWFTALQARTKQAYPEALCQNIIMHNHPVLRIRMSSYLHQIDNAVRRADTVSVNHRVAALLASYFDIVFALNRVLHPGEKRILSFAHNECPQLPTAVDADIASVLAASGVATTDVLVHLNRLLDRLDDQLTAAGFDLPSVMRSP